MKKQDPLRGPIETIRELGQGPCLFKPYTLEKIATLVQNRLKDKGSDA